MQRNLIEDQIKSVKCAIESHNETIALLNKQKQKFSNVEKYREADEINKTKIGNNREEARER